MTRQTGRAAKADDSDDGVVLLLQVSRTNDKKEAAAEQLFASLHGLLTIPATGSGLFKQQPRRERLSFEIAVVNKRVGFFVWVPKALKQFVEEQIYAQYPNVQISVAPDYTMDETAHYATTLVTEMKLTESDVMPIKTFQSFEVDPLATLTTMLAKLAEDEEVWLQLLIKPALQEWHSRSRQYLNRMRGNQNSTANVLATLWQPDAKPKPRNLAQHEQARATGAELKAQKLPFETQLRIVYRGNGKPAEARMRMQSIVAGYKQFNATHMNGFASKRIVDDQFLVAHYRSRAFNRRGWVLNAEELATLYHLPHAQSQTPHVLWAATQTAEPPANLPVITAEPREDVSPIARTTFQGRSTTFGLLRGDRGRHLYIIGQTGVGKSGLLELLAISDLFSPHGFAVIDPHGDYAANVLRRVPHERVDDVIYFNTADTDFPVAFNPLEVASPKLKAHTCSELIGVLRRLFDPWGPQLEYILRYTVLALLDFPEATMLDITRMLTEAAFRQKVLAHVDDPVVQNFWTAEFATWSDIFAAEAIAPVLNKVGTFTANPLVRNIVGQPKSSFNIRQIMDEHKILIVNLNRGLVGEDNAGLLGALLVTKIQLAAMSRADIPAEQRDPFYLYVDEFQNLAADSFATILSEARKYGLSLTVANQYIAQMPAEVRNAMFGNVGSIMAFRTSAEDARTLMKYFEPRFKEQDLIHLHNRHFVANITIDGEKSPAFAGITLDLPPFEKDDASAAVIDLARSNYASSREFVERSIKDRYLAANKPQSAPKPKAAAPPASSPVQKSSPAAALDLGLAALGEAQLLRHSTDSIDSADKPKQPHGPKSEDEASDAHLTSEASKSTASPAAGSTPKPPVERSKPKPRPPLSDEPQEFKTSSVVHLK